MPEEVTQLSRREMQLIERIAQRDGVTVEEAAARLMRDYIARKVRRPRRSPARVYLVRGRT